MTITEYAHDALVAAGVPIVGVAEDRGVLRVDYAGTPKGEDIALAVEVLAGITPLSFARAVAISRLRADASAAIFAAAPEHKQRNAALGLYGDAEAQAIRDAIATGRAAYAEAEASVLAAQTIEEVESITL